MERARCRTRGREREVERIRKKKKKKGKSRRPGVGTRQPMLPANKEFMVLVTGTVSTN